MERRRGAVSSPLMAGWSVYRLEQGSNNRLIRPQSEFVGELGKTFVPVEER
jgi:citrate synthase